MSAHQPTGSDDIQVTLLAEGEQSGADVAGWLAEFIRGAQHRLDIAAYDFRLSDTLRETLTQALRERAQAGVAIRIVYDAGKPDAPNLVRGMDPAPAGTGDFVQSLGYPFRPIGGMKLMHNKFCVSLSTRLAVPLSGGPSSRASTSPAASNPVVRSNSTM